MHRLAQTVIALSFTASCTVAAVAQTPQQDAAAPPAPQAQPDSLYQTIKAMQDEMDRLRKDNQAMKDQIDDLRAKTDADWLTEARAKEIRNLVEDVLADADNRASRLNDGIMAGWSEHFFLADAFGRFLLQVEGLEQIRWIYNYRNRTTVDDRDRNRNGFENTRTRLTFRGHVFSPDLEYMVRGDFNRASTQAIGPGVFNLLDAWVRYNIDNNWSVRVGQFKLPFNREELVAPSEQLAVERSNVNESFNIGRSQGIELSYHDSANAISLAYSDGASATGVLGAILGAAHTNTAALAEDVEYAVTVRYERLLEGSWAQFSDFTSPIGEEFGMLLGVAAHVQQGEATGAASLGRNETREFGATADFSIEWGGANAFVSASYHYTDSPNFQILQIFGLVAQVGVYVAPKWEIFARGEWAQLDTEGGATVELSDLGIVTFGVNYYIEGHDVKWTSDIGFSTSPVRSPWFTDITGWQQVSANGLPEIVFRTQIQLMF